MASPKRRTLAHSFQPTISQFTGFSVHPQPRPCYINDIPRELLMEVLMYLPLMTDAYARVHIDPLNLPESDGSGDEDDEGGDSEEEEEDEELLNRLDAAIGQEGYGLCLAELHHRHGCLRYCSQTRWNYLNVLRVCKIWQATAEDCPGFWNVIAKQNAHTVNRSLLLSGNLPLYVDNDPPWPSIYSLLDTLLHLPRIRTLHISTSSQSEDIVSGMDVINGYFEIHKAPLLDTLWVDYSSWGIYELDTTNWVEKTFPVLKELILDSIELKGPCNLFSPTLVNLALHNCVIPWQTTAELLRVLQSMPVLVDLMIVETNFPPDLSDETRPSVADVALPIQMKHINLLDLRGPLLCISRLLSMLETPLVLDMDICYHHHLLSPTTSLEVVETYNIYDSISRAMPEDAYFSAITLDVDVESHLIEFSFASLENPSEGPCIEKMIHQHTWPWNEDAIFPTIWTFIQRVGAPFLPRVTRVREISMAITLRRYMYGETIQLPQDCFACVLDVAGLTHLLLEAEATAEFMPWIVNLLYEMTETGVREPSSRSFEAKLRSATPLPLQHLEMLRLTGCNMARIVSPHAYGDTLFLYIWLFFHARKPITHLRDVELSDAMLKEVGRLLGERLELDHCKYRVPEEYTRFTVRQVPECSSEELAVTAMRSGMRGRYDRSIIVVIGCTHEGHEPRPFDKGRYLERYEEGYLARYEEGL